jgi:predicted dehydrogenase
MKLTVTRRRFLATSATVCTGLVWGSWAGAGDPTERVWRAAIIGRTGGGDYGHGYDQIFKGFHNISVEAVADADSEGLRKAAERSGAKRQYRDYRQMLEKEKPDLVSIAPRHPDCHRPMALAAIEVCRGIIMEKPMTETPAEADEILAAADRRGVKICVGHTRRYTAEFVRVRALLQQGLIGTVRQVRIQGKQDQRAGGEDLLVLGTHDFDLMRFYFGDPYWCMASVTVGERDITRADVHQGREPVWVAGDTVHAMFGFPNNVMVSWHSVKTADHWNSPFSKQEKWAFEILGTKGIIAYQSGLDFAWLDSPFLAQLDGAVGWRPLPQPKDWSWPDHARHPVKDLIHAIQTDTQPVCSGYDGRWAVEMVAAVYESQRSRARVNLPLAERTHPLLRL